MTKQTTTTTPNNSSTAAADTAGKSVAVNPQLAKAVMVLSVDGARIVLEAGRDYKFKVSPGQKYKLSKAGREKGGEGEQVGENVIALQDGEDIKLRNEDGSTVTLEGFYAVCEDASVCSINVPAAGADGQILSGDSASGAALGDGTFLVYAYGEHDALLSMTRGHAALESLLAVEGSAAGSMLTYLPQSGTTIATAGAAAGFSGVWAALGGGAILAASGGSSGGSSGRSSAAAEDDAVVPTTTINGMVTAGMAVPGNGMTIVAFRADGAQLGQVKVADDGSYSLTYTQAYRGAVLLKLIDADSGADYMDEASSAVKSLNSNNLYAIVTVGVIGQTVTANITPLTDLAARKIGFAGDIISGDTSEANVAAVNNGIAKLFGLTTGSEQIIELLAVPVLDAAKSPLAANMYGKILAAISGVELLYGFYTSDVLSAFQGGIGEAGTFTNDAAGMTARGLLQGGVSRALQAGVIDKVDAQDILALLADADSSEPGVLIYADIVSFKAGQSNKVYFKLSQESADFDAADITVTGGVISALLQDPNDPLLYSATFTPQSNNNLDASIEVIAAEFTNTDGAGNVGSAKLVLKGDTVAPTLEITSNPSTLTNGDITFTFTFSEAVTGFTTDDVTVTHGSKGAFSGSGTTYTLVVTPEAGFEGTVQVTTAAGAAQDAEGNFSSLGVTSVEVDTLAPTTTISTIDYFAKVGSVADGFITNEPVQFINGELSASLVTGETVQVSLDNGVTWSPTSAQAGDAFWSFPATLSASNTLQVRVVDAVGNAGPVTSQAYVLDTIAPELDTVTFTVNENQTAVATLAGTDSNAIRYTFGSGSGGIDNDKFELSEAGVLSFKSAPDFEAPDNTDSNGVYSVLVALTDAAGNSTTKELTINVADVNEAPTAEGSVSNQTAIVGQAFSLDLSAYFADPDTTLANYTLTYSATGLADGLSINATTGVISGSATSAQTASPVIVTATDGGELSVTQSFELAAVAAPVITSAFQDSVVNNFDVRSNIVLTASESVEAVAGKFIHITNTGGAGYRGETENHSFEIDVTDLNQVSIVDGVITINPRFDLDLSNTYTITVDEGAFVGLSSGLDSVAVDGDASMSFSTVTPAAHTPGGTVAAQAVQSQSMDEMGELIAGAKWMDVQGIGNNTGAMAQLGSLLGDDYVLVIKNYANLIGGAIINGGTGRDGVETYDTNIGVTGFGDDDLIYIDSQFNSETAYYALDFANMADAGPVSGGVLGQNLLVFDMVSSPAQIGGSAWIAIGIEDGNGDYSDINPGLVELMLEFNWTSPPVIQG